MLTPVVLKERGTVPRKMIPAHNEAKRYSYREIGSYFHSTFAIRRFTYSHGKAAGYRPRSGDNAPYGSKQYYKSYAGRKRKQKGHRDPMVWSGFTRARARIATIVATGKGANVKYNFNVFNFHPWMHAEFRKILSTEAVSLGKVFDTTYSKKFNAS
jgi:hypothetical protein